MLLELDVEYDIDFLLLGLSCFEKDYRLCWLINKQLSVAFSRADDLCLLRNDVEQCFPRFTYSWESEDAELTLLKNRTAAGVLLPELRQVDYLLKVDAEELPQDLFEQVRQVPRVAAVFVLEPNGLKEKEVLLF